jgi:hypothetical protein
MHCPIRVNFPRNQYSVDILMEVCECDHGDVQVQAQFNDGFRYVLTVINVFSKFVNVLPLRVKKGTAVASEFLSNFKEKKYSKLIRKRQIWVRKKGTRSP